MKEMIMRWYDNVTRYGYYNEITDDHVCIHFENDDADFESEAEFNKCMTSLIRLNEG